MKYDKKELKKILDNIFESINYSENGNYIIGISGQAGAGKTTLVKDLREYYGRGDILSFDYFFKMSSKERKKWIDEANSLEEYYRRSNNLEWFDFEKYYKTIEGIKKGEPVYMKNVYDKYTGELNKDVVIEPGLIWVDGVFILHYPLDFILYLHRDWKNRKANIEKRDGHRKSKEALEQRWRETQGTEIPYFGKTLHNADKIYDAEKREILVPDEKKVYEIIKRSIDPEYKDSWRKYVEEKLSEITKYDFR